MTIDPALNYVLRMVLATVLLAASWHKLSDRRTFARVVARYELFPERWAPFLATWVPTAELGAAVVLASPKHDHAGGWIAMLLLASYTAGIAVNLARGRRHIDCGCFFARGHVPLGPGLLFRNGALIAMALATVLPTTARPLVWLDAVVMIVAVAAFWLVWSSTARLFQTGPALRQLRGNR